MNGTPERTPLSDLGQQAQRIAEMQASLPQLVQQARLSGASWSAIGQQLGISKQAAQQKYGDAPIGWRSMATEIDVNQTSIEDV